MQLMDLILENVSKEFREYEKEKLKEQLGKNYEDFLRLDKRDRMNK